MRFMSAPTSTAATQRHDYAAVRDKYYNNNNNRNNTNSPSSSLAIQVQGRSLLVPRTSFSRAVVAMGNNESSSTGSPCCSHTIINNRNNNNVHSHPTHQDGRPLSNLSVLMMQQETTAEQQQQQQSPPDVGHVVRIPDEADSACDLPRRRRQHHVAHLGSSAPLMHQERLPSHESQQQHQEQQYSSFGNHHYHATTHPHSPAHVAAAAPTQLSRHASLGAFRGDPTRRYGVYANPPMTLGCLLVPDFFCFVLTLFCFAHTHTTDAFRAKNW